MKVKNVMLDIQNENDFISGLKRDLNDISEGKSVEPESTISFDTVKTMKKFISDERVRILKVIKKYNPASIYELAKLLKRDTKNVSNDVYYLSELGLIEIEKTKEGRAKTKPVVDYDKIVVEIAI